jgi:hypothetical protein
MPHLMIRRALLLCAAVILAASVHSASAQAPLGTANPATTTPPAIPPRSTLVAPPSPTATPVQSTPAPQVATQGPDDAPAVSVPAGWGLCQCISDTKILDFSCPGSAAGCQSQCGGNYSFVPDAQCRTVSR